MHTLDNKNIFSVTAGLLFLTLAACGDKNKGQVAPPPPPPVVETPPVLEQPKEKPVYVYSGDRFRDPFMTAGQSSSYQPDAVFDPQRAAIKGIIYGPYYKSAVLTVGGTGSYFIKSGKIIDIMGKPVEGFTAKVFADKVLIQGEADNIYELKIKDEEEKPL